MFQTAVVTLWVAWNVLFRDREAGFDPYPFILLTLALSLQASYAAPLILLAQNRQAERDRQESERDRRTSTRTQADTEYLARSWPRSAWPSARCRPATTWTTSWSGCSRSWSGSGPRVQLGLRRRG